MGWVAVIDGDARLGQAAVEKAWWGVLPGQLSNGRWMDGHNARVVYHTILMSSLAPLLPFAGARRVAIESSLTAALASYSNEMAAAKATAGEGWAIRAFIDTASTRPLGTLEAETLALLRRGAVTSSGVRVASAVDLLLVEKGLHPFERKLQSSANP
jgi:hypothetical protein